MMEQGQRKQIWMLYLMATFRSLHFPLIIRTNKHEKSYMMFFAKSNICQATGKFTKPNRVVKTIFTALISVPLLNGCSYRAQQPADVEYDVTQSPYHVVRRG